MLLCLGHPSSLPARSNRRWAALAAAGHVVFSGLCGRVQGSSGSSGFYVMTSSPQIGQFSSSRSFAVAMSQQDEEHLRPQDVARCRLPSLGLPSSRTDLFSTDDGPPPTPPYQLDASKSQEVIDRALPPDYDREHKQEDKQPHVRYPDEDGGELPRPVRPAPAREFSNMSGAASIAGSDYEDDLEEKYHWSDEDDLLDEEAKFERTTGQRKRVRTGCGCTRSVSSFLFFFSLTFSPGSLSFSSPH